MNEAEHNTVICIDVTFETADGRVLFKYQGADEISRNHVDEKGNVDLCKPADLGRGPVDLWFRLQVPRFTLQGIDHYLSFATRDSIWIAEAKCGTPVGPYRPRGILACCGLRPPQFYGYANPESEARNLRLSDRNNDGKEYKYTLRVLAAGIQGARWLEDDPRIKNRGGNAF